MIQMYSLYPCPTTFLTRSRLWPPKVKGRIRLKYKMRFRRPPQSVLLQVLSCWTGYSLFFLFFPLQSSLSRYLVFLCLLTSHTNIPGKNLVAQRLAPVDKHRGLMEQGWVCSPPAWGAKPQLCYLSDTWLSKRHLTSLSTSFLTGKIDKIIQTSQGYCENQLN